MDEDFFFGDFFFGDFFVGDNCNNRAMLFRSIPIFLQRFVFGFRYVPDLHGRMVLFFLGVLGVLGVLGFLGSQRRVFLFLRVPFGQRGIM